MRFTLFIWACALSTALGTRLLAQDGMSRQQFECADNGDVSEISIMFDGVPSRGAPGCGMPASCTPNCGGGTNDCGATDCGADACVPNSCAVGSCAAGSCAAGSCTPGSGDQGACEQAGCNQPSGNRAGNGDNCDPYTYYQLREDWRKTHGPILDSVRYLHSTCPKKHHCLLHHNGNAAAQRRAAQTPWHGSYYYPQWGGPVALVVPPTAEFQTNYGWGVPASRISPIDAQFSRSFPGYGSGVVGGTGFLPPPLQPSDTNQFGVYYVRGPW